MSAASPDWTQGQPRIVYQQCGACQQIWYFRRDFCPHCGAVSPQQHDAAGTGTVHAVTLVARAPTEAWRAHVPYLIALVDADDGFRMMAHGDRSLRIGDRVHVRFITLGEGMVPYFEKNSA
jgi:uncharacterized protein